MAHVPCRARDRLVHYRTFADNPFLLLCTRYTYGVALEATLTWGCNAPVTCLRCLAKGS